MLLSSSVPLPPLHPLTPALSLSPKWRNLFRLHIRSVKEWFSISVMNVRAPTFCSSWSWKYLRFTSGLCVVIVMWFTRKKDSSVTLNPSPCQVRSRPTNHTPTNTTVETVPGEFPVIPCFTWRNQGVKWENMLRGTKKMGKKNLGRTYISNLPWLWMFAGP